MKFLVDAQLPASLATLLTAAGHDAVHVSRLPQANRTADAEIMRRADEEGRTVVTKDRDFRDAHLLNDAPRSLLIVTTGNIRNSELLALVDRHLVSIVEFLTGSSMVELSGDRLIAHSRSGS